jgi:hypothetical protein
MGKHMQRTLRCLSRWSIVTALGLGIVICLSAPAWTQPQKRQEKNWRNYQSLSPEEKGRLNKNLQRWKSLPPERKRVLRRRMDQWKELPPEERTHYQQRFHQWQKLSPEERTMIREKLEKGKEGLPPQDREEIRRRFLTP